jgi:hypothetical protein
MTHVKKDALHQYLSMGGRDYDNLTEFTEKAVGDSAACLLDDATFTALKTADIKTILIGFGMSCDHLGGDDVINIVNQTLAATAEGYSIVTWYGPESEVLIAGYRRNQVSISDTPPSAAGETILMPPIMAAVTVDPSAFESADNEVEATTYYGGCVKVGDKVITCAGTDRDSFNCYDDVRSAIFEALNLDEKRDLPFDQWTEEYQSLQEALQIAIDGKQPFDVCVAGDKLWINQVVVCELRSAF